MAAGEVIGSRPETSPADPRTPRQPSEWQPTAIANGCGGAALTQQQQQQQPARYDDILLQRHHGPRRAHTHVKERGQKIKATHIWFARVRSDPLTVRHAAPAMSGKTAAVASLLNFTRPGRRRSLLGCLSVCLCAGKMFCV